MKWRTIMKTLFNARVNFKYLGFQLKQNKTLMFVFGILFFAVFPLSIITASMRPFTSTIMQVKDPHYIPVFLLVVACVVFLVTPIIIFNFLFSKKSVDTFHALPIRRSDLFLTSLFTSWIITIIPYILNYLIGYSLAYSLTNVIYEIEHVTLLMHSVIVLCAISSITIFVIMNTGALSEGFIYTGIACLLPIFGLMAFSFFADQFLYGYTNEVGEYLKYLSPFVGLYNFANYNNLSSATNLSILASYWFLSLVFTTVISVCIYDKKPSEKAEEPFTNNIFFPVVSSAFTLFLFVSLISVFAPYNSSRLELSYMLVPATISLIVYIILNIIKNRSTKNMLKVLRNFAIISLVSIIMTFAIDLTKGFGYITRMPNKENIDYVVVNSGLQTLFPLQSPYENSTVTFRSPSEIDAILNLHQSILDEYELTQSKPDLYGYYSTYNISYKLKSGATFNRQYYVENEKVAKIFATYTEELSVKDTLPLFNEDKNYDTLYVLSKYGDKEYTFKGDIETFKEIYSKELGSTTFKDYIQDGESLQYILVYGRRNEFILLDGRYTNSIEYIESNVEGPEEVYVGHSLYKNSNNAENCGYNVFNGIAVSSDYFYQCSSTIEDLVTLDNITSYDLYPFSYKKITNDVTSIEIYEDNYQISIFVPIVKH